MNKIKINGNNTKITLGSNSPIIEEKDKSNFLNDWFIKSIIVCLLFVICSYIIFQSIKLSIIIGLCCLILFFWLNPKRRFFKIGVFSLISGISLISATYFKLTIPENPYLFFTFEKGGDTTSYIISIILIISSLFLFNLDSKEK